MALLYATLWKYEMAAKHARMQVTSALRRRRSATTRCSRAEERAPSSSSSDRRLAARAALHRPASTWPPPTSWSFALVLIYVAIMAIRLSRIERNLGELLERPAPAAEPEEEPLEELARPGAAV